jgi:hypothetical protein
MLRSTPTIDVAELITNLRRNAMAKKPPSDEGPPENAGGAVENASRATDNQPPSVAADLLSPEERHFRISLAAYRRAEVREFAPGGSLEDWLLAEREVDSAS